MYLSETNSRTKSHLNISNVEPRFGATKLAAGAPHIRAFCECAGVCAIRCILILAVISAALLIAARPAQAQTETVLYNFTGGSDGSHPDTGLTSDGAGNFYGATELGGLGCPGNGSGCGVVFEISPNGGGGWNETVLHSFSGPPDGANPVFAPVVFDKVGNLYGTTGYGGSDNAGALYELSPAGASWTEAVLYSFGNDWYYPTSSLIMDSAGNLYGATNWGGDGDCGTVFELSPSGAAGRRR